MAAPNNFYWKQYEGEAQAALVALAHDDGKGGSLRELPQAVRHTFRLAITSDGNGNQFLEVSQYEPTYLQGDVRFRYERPFLMYREEWRESSAGGEDAEESCASCGKTGADLKRCTACKRVWYCDVTCQRKHRKAHRDECKRIEKGGGFVGRTDDDNVLSRLLIAATMAMLEGGRLLAEQSPGVSIATLSSMPAHFFQPRRPGLLLISAELLPWLERIKERLGDPLNFIVAKRRENGYGDHLYLTPGNTTIDEEGGFHLRVLTKEERAAEADNMFRADPVMKEIHDNDVDLYPEIEDLIGSQRRYEREGYDNIDDALKEMGDEYSKEDLEEETFNWQDLGYQTLEKACMDNYDAKSIEEVKWDYVAVPRIKIIWPVDMDWSNRENAINDQNAMMVAGGWEYMGYKPGRDVAFSESNMKYGARVIGGYGGGWQEKRRR